MSCASARAQNDSISLPANPAVSFNPDNTGKPIQKIARNAVDFISPGLVEAFSYRLHPEGLCRIILWCRLLKPSGKRIAPHG